MTQKTIKARFLPRTGNASEFTSKNPVLLLNELVIEKDTGKKKLGDGVTAYNKLPYLEKTNWGEIIGVPDTFAPSEHTHKYASSSSAGGSATSADKLNTNAGNAATPVYFENGIPKPCTSLQLEVTGTSEAANKDSAGNVIVDTYATKNELTKYSKTEDFADVAFSGAYSDITGVPTSLPADGGDSDTVNGHTVESDVPANAKFTDTIYTLPNATSNVLGGVKIGTNVDVSNGIISIADASTSVKGVVQLTNSATSTSYTTAATPAAVKAAYDLANSKQSPATTLSGYGITNAYTKTEVDNICDAADEANTNAHNEIKSSISNLTTRLNTLADSDDTTLDQMSEVVAYIKTNKDLIDAITTTKADADHTHNYAGSSSAGGAATSANKLNTDAGSATQPIYFANGIPVKTTYTLGASVPSGAKFTDTVYTHPNTHAASMITGLADVATSGSYNDLLDKPTALPADGGDADTVNGYTVASNVPENAKFTDTVYTHPSYTAQSAGLYKFTVTDAGHVSAVYKVTKDDITGLGIPAQDTTYVAATNGAAGLMSAADKAKLDGIAEGANNYTYTLPTASKDTLGGVKTTSTVTNASSYTACPIVDGVPYYKNSTYTAMTASEASTGTASTTRSITAKVLHDKIVEVVEDNVYTHPSTHEASMITGLSTVAMSGSYNDLSNKPTIPTSLPANGGNADTVGGFTVEANVPADAKFTDTVYTLPNATTSTLGGVKVGTNISVSSGTISVANGSTSAKGVVQLTNSTSSTSTTTAATPNSVKSAYDLANSKQSPATTLSGYGITNAYTKTEVDGLISNTNTSITNLTTRLNTLADSDDTTLDQMSEVVAYIKSNKNLIDAVTTAKADAEHTHDISDVTNLQTTLNAKAALASPTFTGTPKAPTATAGTNTTQLATTAFVTTAVANKTSVANATKATQDASGNVITDTYEKKANAITGLSASGKTITYTKGDGTTGTITTQDTNTTYTAMTASEATTGTATTARSITAKVLHDKITEVVEDNAYTHPSYTAKSSGLYKITVDSSGHVSAATAVAKSDITGLGIPAQDTTYSAATTSTAGLMSATDKAKLDGIAEGANNYTYTLPNATSSTLGGVKVGTNISVSSGAISVANGSTSTKGVVQLSSATNSTSTSLAATASAVKAAYDLANGKQSPATTLSGYGITNAYTKTEVDNLLEASATKVTIKVWD